MRNFKILRPIKKKGKIKPFAVVDTETWGLGGSLAFGCVYISDKDFFYFKTKEEFYKGLRARKIKLVYAHNLDFDATKIRDKSSLEDTKGSLYAGGLLLTFRDEYGITWRDSYALLKSKVSDLGKEIGFKKLETPKKFIEPRESNKYISSKDQRYCKRDCKIVKLYLDLLFETIGTQKLTIASSCMHLFRSKFLKENLLIRSQHKEFKASYYGGRVECFKLGKVDANVYDINSQYPYNMLKTDIPDPSRLKTVYPDLKTFDFLLKNFEGCAEVKVFHPVQKIGMLPYRINSKLCFPSGKFQGTWNFNELRFAINNGLKILEVSKVTYSDKTINIFKNYVEEYYKLKSESSGAMRLFYKFFLNTLYGKFGENSHSERVYVKERDLFSQVKKLSDKKTNFVIHELKRGYYYIDIKADLEKEPIHTIFPICSYITSAARIQLLKLLLDNEEGLIYCDTDSIATEKEFKGKISKNLGDCLPESYKIKRVIGNKTYKTDEGFKAKGIPKGAVLEGRLFKYEHLIKSKESLRRGLKAGSTEERFKTISFEYDKRVKKRNGETKILEL